MLGAATLVVVGFVARSEADPGGGQGAGDVSADARVVHPLDVLRRIDQQAGSKILAFQYNQADPRSAEDRSLAPYLFVAGGDERVDRLPLKETSARIRVAGPIAHVEVRQVFENRGRQPIEAVYVFPASTRAAVHGMRMTIGTRTIEAHIDERAAARREYEQARAEGRRASLLEQQRPNVFTTSVANVMPGDRIEVALRYSELLVPEDGTYELVYPAVVGPRYAGNADPERDGFIANPHLPEGRAEPYRFDVSATLEAGLPIRDVSSPSHALATTFATPTSAAVRIDGPRPGNRDFVLRWELAGDAVEAGLLRFEDAGEKFFLLQVEPPARPRAAIVPAREYVFVLDVSGSMSGFPLDTTKALMRRLLGGLRPNDSFNVVLFAGSSSVLSREGSVPASAANVARAIQQIEHLQGGGGTELMGGLRTAFGLPRRGAGTSRSVVLVSDGYVTVEAQAFRFVRENLGEGNFFALGIGSSVNRALIEGLARAGQGEPFVVLGPEFAAGAAERFRRYIDTPVLTDVSVRFDGLAVQDVTPQELPDVMAARPIVVLGRYEGAGTGTVVVSGRNGEGPWSKRIDFAAHAPNARYAPIRHLFARHWVEALEDRLSFAQGDEGLEGAIKGLGLRYHLLTPFTSFVAVDSAVANRTGGATEVRQPLPLPQGVTEQALAGGATARHGFAAAARVAVPSQRMAQAPAAAGRSADRMSRSAPAPSAPALRPSAADSGTSPAAALEGARREPGDAASPRQALQTLLRRDRTAVQRCYVRLVPAQLRTQTRVLLALVIGADGAIRSAVVTGLGNAPVEQCIAAIAGRWRLPAAPGGARLTVPFVLQPR